MFEFLLNNKNVITNGLQLLTIIKINDSIDLKDNGDPLKDVFDLRLVPYAWGIFILRRLHSLDYKAHY